jgi:DNA-binding NarL/FixJ family response regulator
MRVLLADAEPDVRWALRLLLVHELGADDIAEASGLDGLWTALRQAPPDLLLLDWAMPGPNAAGIVTRLRAAYPSTTIVALSCRTEEQQAALAAGVDTFVCKSEAPGPLAATLRSACTRRGGVHRVQAEPRAGGHRDDVP